MQYRSRATAPASHTAVASMMPSTRSSASSSHSHSDVASSSSLIYHSSEEEDLGDPEVLAHDISEFFGGIPAPKKPKKAKVPKAPKQKTVKAHVVDLPLDATATGVQPRESTSRLRRLCKAIVSTSKA